eukprot:8753807-Lingulodinium_polyedra.AAC.1
MLAWPRRPRALRVQLRALCTNGVLSADMVASSSGVLQLFLNRRLYPFAWANAMGSSQRRPSLTGPCFFT